MLKRFFISILAAALLLSLFCFQTVNAAGNHYQAGTVTVSSGWLNVRSSASTNGSKIASLKKGSLITLVSKSGDWWKVEYAKGKFGYSHADYISSPVGTSATVKITSGSLNVRSGAGTNYAKTGTLGKGETVVILSQSSGWSKILYHGIKTGYVSSQYLSTANSGSASNASISLNVPDFKQMDSRWRDVEVAQSGKTMAQIGCATTAIAMLESYRTGTTIYPDAMMESLRYTSSGNVYWPGHFVTITDSTGYLNTIYAKLKVGKPVLYGAMNSYGKQHWVVIHGYNGGDVQSPASYLIHDPGSNSRTTLQQFVSEYSKFYKYFYY